MPFVAARTKQIHIGSGIINITPPVNHPARVAERVAMLDHLSEGRFEFGTGAARRPPSRPASASTTPSSPRRCTTRRSASSRRCGAPGTYSYDGKFFSMPERNVLPKPYVKPHPPMWVAAGNPGTFEKAGKMGLGVLCFTGGAPEKMAPLIEIYKNAIAERRAGRRVRERQRRGHHELHVPRGPRRGASTG